MNDGMAECVGRDNPRARAVDRGVPAQAAIGSGPARSRQRTDPGAACDG
jgi:hypothetical protein